MMVMALAVVAGVVFTVRLVKILGGSAVAPVGGKAMSSDSNDTTFSGATRRTTWLVPCAHNEIGAGLHE